MQWDLVQAGAWTVPSLFFAALLAVLPGVDCTGGEAVLDGSAFSTK